MTAREKIFADLQAALASLPSPTPHPEVPYGVADAQWLAEAPETLTIFLERAQEIGTACFTDPTDLVTWLASQVSQQVYVPPGWDELADSLAEVATVTRTYRRAQLHEIDAALTPATAAIAESGSVILTDQDTTDRLAALTPWIHIAIIRPTTIHRSIADALATIPTDPNVIWVTGPSKTADVEGILVQGVHGPGIQACLIEGEK